MPIQNCWEIKKCGREAGGRSTAEFGVCPAYPRWGHSCWAISGTLCGGKVQGTFAEKEHSCLTCEVYGDYNRSFGDKLRELEAGCAAEVGAYSKLMAERLKRR